MIKLNHDISLDLYYNEEKTIDTKEYDKDSRYITVQLTYKGEKYTISGNNIKATIKWLKPDKKAVFNDCIINSDNTITINLTEQMLLVSGVAKATLTLYDIANDQVLSTTSFNAIIEANAVQNETIMSSDEYDTLNKMILDEDKRIETVKELDKMVAEHESARQAHEEIREANEIKRQADTANAIENVETATNNANIATENANKATSEAKIATDNANSATENANEAAKNANDKANDLQTKLDNHHFVLTNELENSVSSTSTTHAPTANAVKTAYDKAVSVENTINSNKNNWNDKYTKNEIDNKFSTLESNIDWKESVNSYADIAKTYPNPEDGWTVNVKDTDYTYRYSGSAWVAISANAIPKATQSLDGLLSKEDKSNYDDANNKKHTHSNKSVLDGITSALITAWNNAVEHITDTVKHITSSERTKWNAAYDKANNALPKTGGTLTGSLDIYGNASQNPLRTRGIVGSDGQGSDGDLYLQYGSAGNIYLGKNGSGCIDEDGKSYNGTAMSSRYPFGFNSYTPANITWGVQTGTPLVAWNTSNGGSIGFRDNCPADGQVSVVIDGRVYQDEGRYPVLDSNNYTSVITKQGICDILGYTPSTEDLESALSIRDYNDTSKKIKVGWVGSALNEDQILAIACYASGDDDTVKAKVKDVTKDTFKSWLGTVPPSDGSNNYVKVFNSSNVNHSDNLTVDDLADQGFAAAMIAATEDSPIGSGWFHALNLGWDNSKNNWVSQIALGTQPNDGLYYRTSEASIVGKPWKRVLDSSNYTNYALKNENLSNVDLNNVTTTGIYHLTGTLTNNPINGNATLYVEFDVGTPYQIFIPDYMYVMYKRTYSSSTWGEWYEFGGSSSSSVAWDNITGRPSSYPPEAHNHNTLDSDFGCTLPDNTTATYTALNSNGYTTGYFLKTIRGQYTAPSWFEDNYASGIAFGGADTHAVISCRYEFPRVTFCGGNGTEPNWWMRLAGTSGHSYNMDDFITTSGTDSLAGSIIPNEDVAMDLGDSTHRFTNVYSTNITTGAIWMEHDSNAIYESGNDAANGNGGGLNNLVIRSWWGVSFTSPASGGRYGGKNQTAVGIDCREGIVKAYNFDGLINGHSVNADVPSNATYIESYGSSDNYVFSDCYGSGSGTNYYYIRYTNGIQMIFIEIHNDNSRQNVSQGSGKKTISFPVSFVNNKYFAFGKQNISSDASGNNLVSFSEKNTSSIDVRHYPYGYNEAADYFSMFFVGRWK